MFDEIFSILNSVHLSLNLCYGFMSSRNHFDLFWFNDKRWRENKSMTLWDEGESRDIFDDQIWDEFLTVSLDNDHSDLYRESFCILWQQTAHLGRSCDQWRKIVLAALRKHRWNRCLKGSMLSQGRAWISPPFIYLCCSVIHFLQRNSTLEWHWTIVSILKNHLKIVSQVSGE